MADARGTPHHDRAIERRRSDVSSQRQDDRFSRLSAGLCRRLRRSAGRTGRTRRRAAARRASTNRSACRELEPKSHTTQPPGRSPKPRSPARWKRWASAGRARMPRSSTRFWPANMSSRRGTALVPTWTAFAVSQLVGTHLPDLVDYQLHGPDGRRSGRDQPRRKRARRLSAQLLFRQRRQTATGLKQQLENKVEQIDARDVSRVTIGQPEGQEPIFVRVGRYGPFLEQGERRASLPDSIAPDELTVPIALELLEPRPASRRAAGDLPRHRQAGLFEDRPVRPLRAAGRRRRREKPQNASLLKGMTPEDIDLPMAVKLLVAAARFGPESDERRNGAGLQRPIRAVCEMRRGKTRNAFAAGGRFAARRDARRKRSNCWPSRKRSAAASAQSASR